MLIQMLIERARAACAAVANFEHHNRPSDCHPPIALRLTLDEHGWMAEVRLRSMDDLVVTAPTQEEALAGLIRSAMTSLTEHRRYHLEQLEQVNKAIAVVEAQLLP